MSKEKDLLDLIPKNKTSNRDKKPENKIPNFDGENSIEFLTADSLFKKEKSYFNKSSKKSIKNKDK